MPAEAVRLQRQVGVRDKRFLYLLAGAAALITVFVTIWVGANGASTPRTDCVTFDEAGVMGGGTWHFCGADAVTFCKTHIASDPAKLAAVCAKLN
jgi:hypothetical protein